jgi:hypothetical protein
MKLLKKRAGQDYKLMPKTAFTAKPAISKIPTKISSGAHQRVVVDPTTQKCKFVVF